VQPAGQGAGAGDARAELPQPAQQLRHLDAGPGAAAVRHRGAEAAPAPIARGEIRWCQGYSEPNAGSDLASLATRAEDGGDHFVVNGQKIWTSYADKADWIFCLVRTSVRRKHTGISFVLFDMASPGVSTQPILLISGAQPVLRDLLRQRARAEAQPGRHAQQGLGCRQVPAATSAR
jgi:alkylation response protein AidB-like acyl-CoA dehydrogenase